MTPLNVMISERSVLMNEYKSLAGSDRGNFRGTHILNALQYLDKSLKEVESATAFKSTPSGNYINPNDHENLK